MKYVIVGNSAAAVGAVENIRKVDQEGKITIVSDEVYHTYSRPLISYYLADKVTEEQMLYRKDNFYEKNNVDVKLGTKAVGLNPKEKIVTLEKGEKVGYDKLLIATGGKPFVPPIDGLDKENVYSFIKLDDAKDIEKSLQKSSKVVIVGSGLIGLKAAEALAQKGVEVTIVELANRVLSAILDEESAGIVQKNLEEQGIEFVLNTTIEEVQGSKKAKGVALQNGQKLDCDLIIVAIGVTPNVEMVKDSGIEINKGIVVSERLETSITDVYAAGDVSEGEDILFGGKRVLPILPNAYKQGEVAGLNMAGNDATYPGGFAMNSIGFFGLPMITAGIVKPEGEGYEVLVKYQPEEKIYKKIILKDERVVGFICLNEINRAGIYTGLINDKINVESFKETLLKDDFGYVYFPEELRKSRMLKGR